MFLPGLTYYLRHPVETYKQRNLQNVVDGKTPLRNHSNLTGRPQEFMIATDMTSSGDPEEKLRWAFRMYDKDGSGRFS